MSVLERSELEASPLSDLHAIADQLGLDGFRRLRKPELIDAILGEPVAGSAQAAADEPHGEGDGAPPPPAAGGRRGSRPGRTRPRTRRASASGREVADGQS